MNKLGFAIKLASQGAGNAIECNKGQWTNKVVDIRDYLKLFNGLQGTDNVVTFILFDEGGCFLTQLRAISGRGGDFLSGWIYIPNTIEATGDDILNAFNFVRSILSQSNINESKEQIDAFFSKEYPLKEYVVPYLPSQGDKFGVRFLGVYTLKEILDGNRYQSYYSDCKAIFLMDKSGEVSITKEAAQNMFLDYTKKEIVKSAVFVPPSSDSLQLLGRGTKIFTSHGVEFKEPIFVSIGTKQEIILKRNGFENMRFDESIKKDIQNLDVSKLQVIWKKRISSSIFKICNSKNEPIQKGVNITVNDQDITYKEILLSEDECQNAVVKVTAADFEIYESRENLLKGEIQIKLRRRDKTFQSNIELANGKVAEITLKSKDIESSHSSPLKGYDFDKYPRGENCLRMSSEFLWKQRLYGFFSALVIGLAVFFGYLTFFAPENTGTGESPDSIDQTGTNVTVIGIDSLSLENAIKYLDEKTVWDKNEMEKYPDLQGLFDALNRFELSAIIDEWSDKLKDSEKILKIKEAAEKNSNNGWNPKQKGHNPTYNKENDMQIDVSNYIKWLDKDQSKSGTSNSNAPRVQHRTVSTGSSSQGSRTNQSNPAPGASGDIFENGNGNSKKK